MAEIYLDPQSLGVVVVTKAGRRVFPCGAEVAEIAEHLLTVTRGRGTTIDANSLGTLPMRVEPPADLDLVPITKVKARGKARSRAPAVHMSLEELLS